MKLYNALKNYIPFNAQEAEDKVRILKFIDENKAVRWFIFEDALKASSEPWMVENVYEKLIAKIRTKLRV